MDIPVKPCSQCQYPLPLSAFHKGACRDGHTSICKACTKQLNHDSYVRRRQAVLTRTKTYTQAHPEVRRAATKRWTVRHPERARRSRQRTNQKRRAAGKTQVLTHLRVSSGRAALATRRYRANHPERIKAAAIGHWGKYGKAYFGRYPKRQRAKWAQRRYQRWCAKIGAPFEAFDIIEIWRRDGGLCHISHTKVQHPNMGIGPIAKAASLDHLVPVSDRARFALVGHTRVNVRLAHVGCNSRRGAGRLPAQLLLFGA